jgi:hypothetical protein
LTSSDGIFNKLVTLIVVFEGIKVSAVRCPSFEPILSKFVCLHLLFQLRLHFQKDFKGVYFGVFGLHV